MADEKWVTVAERYCDVIDQDIEIREQRLFPTTDILNTFCVGYRVRAYECSAAVQCNLAGVPCRLAFTSLDVDQLKPVT